MKRIQIPEPVPGGVMLSYWPILVTQDDFTELAPRAFYERLGDH